MPNVSAIMTTDPSSCIPSARLTDAAKLMLECDCGEIPVVDSEESRRPIGVVTDRDIVIRTIARDINPMELTVEDCMSTPAYTVTAETDIDEVLQLMQDHQIRRVPVVDEDGRLCGIVSQADIAGSLSPRDTGEVVREVSQPASH